MRWPARRWYRRHGRPVTIVIPSFRDAALVTQLVAKIRQTTARDQVRIIVADDASGPEHVAALRAIEGIEVPSPEIATSALRPTSTAACAPPIPRTTSSSSTPTSSRSAVGWPALQYADHARPRRRDRRRQAPVPRQPDPVRRHGPQPRRAGVVRPSLPLQAGGLGAGQRRRPDARRHRRLHVRPARGDRARSACFDEGYPMAYEDVDWCLRAWQAGFQVVYCPTARLHHHESVTRGTEVGERERASQRLFWERWGEFFDARPVRTESGALRVIYVTEDTGVGGGHRDIFEHLNGWPTAATTSQLWTLEEAPDWFELRAPVRSFEDYEELEAALAPVEAIKVATWWEHRGPVWRASVPRGSRSTSCRTSRPATTPTTSAAACGARLLPPGVPLHDDLLLEPRAPARAGPRRRADPSRHRPRELSGPAGWPATATWCSRSGAPTR